MKERPSLKGFNDIPTKGLADLKESIIRISEPLAEVFQGMEIESRDRGPYEISVASCRQTAISTQLSDQPPRCRCPEVGVKPLQLTRRIQDSRYGKMLPSSNLTCNPLHVLGFFYIFATNNNLGKAKTYFYNCC
jgi:hypothetical protein